MGIDAGADTRPTAPVRRDVAGLAVDLFVATQRATIALQAAEQLNYRHPTRGNAMAIAEAHREVQALAEAHALIKALVPYAEALADGLPGVFVAEPAAPRPLAVIQGGRA